MELWIATQNKHKIDEYKSMLEPLGYQIKTLLDLEEVIDIDETGETFEENAVLKAESLSKRFKTTWISDDSGFEVDALDKKPGVYSARYLGYDTSYKVKNQTILDQIEGTDNRSCRFVCVVALAVYGEKTIFFRGETEGRVAEKITGENGFGYDPIFHYPPLNKTFGEVTEKEKNKVSHRAKACQKLMEYLNEKKL